MEAFKQYIIDEFRSNAPGLAASEFKFSHSAKIKIDKKSSVSVVMNTIRVGVKLFDKDLNVLVSKSISFENNLLNKTSKKSLINIAPAELENRFNSALPEIAKVIMNDYIDDLEQAQTKIELLSRYIGPDVDLTPSEFKGERTQVIDINVETKNKTVYDM